MPDLTEKQQFKYAFLNACIEAGITDPASMAHAARQSREKVAWVGDLVRPAGWMAAAAPPLAGLAIGHGLGKATGTSEESVESIKRQQLIDQLRRHTRELRRDAPEEEDTRQADR